LLAETGTELSYLHCQFPGINKTLPVAFSMIHKIIQSHLGAPDNVFNTQTFGLDKLGRLFNELWL